jgi:hypothetical protein
LAWGISTSSPEEREAFDASELAVGTTIDLIGQALLAVLRYLLVLHKPEVWAEEQQRLFNWLDELTSTWSGQPRLSPAYRYGHSLRTPRRGWLSCEPVVGWVLIPPVRQPSVGRFGSGTEERPTWDLYPELKLCFCHGNPDACVPPRKRLDVLVCSGGERERLPLSRKVRKLLHPRLHERAAEQLSGPFADKRLYLPEGISSPSDVRAAVQDMHVLLCLYLVQEEFVKLDEEEDVEAFLYDYISQFKRARQLEIRYVLGEILAHYQSPEDYRAVRKYVAKTIRGLLANERRREGWGAPQPRDTVPVEGLAPSDRPDAAIPGALMIPEAAAALGISVRSLYDYRKRGKVRAEEAAIGDRRFLTIPMDEIARLKASFVPKHLRRVLIEARAEKAGSGKASARRWVERQKALGLGPEAIGPRIREMPAPGEELDETER